MRTDLHNHSRNHQEGEGYTVEGYRYWTRVPLSSKDVEDIKSCGDKAVPILEEYLFSDVGPKGAFALEILGRLGGSPIVKPLKRVVEQSTSAWRRQFALSWLTQAPRELALPIIPNAPETDRDPEVRAVARDLLVQWFSEKRTMESGSPSHPFEAVVGPLMPTLRSR